MLAAAERPILLAGHGVARHDAAAALRNLAEAWEVPVATTFHGKGVFPDDHPLALGAVGFMRHDYANFGFDQADAIVAVGYELQEFDPEKINPSRTTPIVHVHTFPAEVDEHYAVTVGIEADLSRALDALGKAVQRRFAGGPETSAIRRLLAEELDRGAADDRCPLAPQRIVADVRAALGRDDIVLADTDAVKSGWPGCTPPTAPTPACSPTACPRWASRCPARSPRPVCGPKSGRWPRWATGPS